MNNLRELEMQMASFFNKSERDLRDLFSPNKRYTIIAGAGISMDEPSCLLSARQIVGYLIDACCPPEEKNSIMALDGLRYELVIEAIKKIYDPELNFMNFFDFFEKPNINHHLCAAIIIQELGDVITTNFDYLIELAAMDQLDEKQYPRIMPVITREDFAKFNHKEDIEKLRTQKRLPICKIHGSKKNIISGNNTTDSLVTTMADLGKGRGGGETFAVEPYKRPLLTNLTDNRSLIVIGYSGSDDFDIGPTLKSLPNVKEIFWINHIMDEFTGNADHYEVVDDIQYLKIDPNLPQIDRVLGDLGKSLRVIESDAKIYRIDVNTGQFIEKFLWNVLFKDKKIPKIGTYDRSKEELSDIIKGLLGSDLGSEILQWEMAYIIYDRLFKREKGLECAEKMMAIAKKVKNSYKEGKALLYKSTMLQTQNKFEESVKCYNQALEIADEDYKDELYEGLGECFKSLGRYKDAIKMVRKGINIAKKQQDLESLTSLTYSMGQLYVDQGRYKKAMDTFNLGLDYADKIGDLLNKSSILTQIAGIKMQLHQMEEVDEVFNEVLKILKILNDTSGIAYTYHNMGVLKTDQKKYEEALKLVKIGLEKAEYLPRPKAACYFQMGLAYHYMGDYENALRHFRQSEKIYSQLKVLPNLSEIYSCMAVLYRDQKKFDESIQYHKKALNIADKIRNLRVKSLYLVEYGFTLGQMDKTAEEREIYEQSLKISEELSRMSDTDIIVPNRNIPHINVIYMKFNIAICLGKEDKFTESNELFEELLPFNEILFTPVLRIVGFRRIGNNYDSLGEHEKAIETYMKAKELCNEDDLRYQYQNVEKEIGYSYIALKQYDKSKPHLDRAMAINERAIEQLDKEDPNYENDLRFLNRDLSNVINNLAILEEKQKNIEKAVELYTKSYEIDRDYNFLDNSAIVLRNIGNLYYDVNNFNEAKKYFLKAAKIFGEVGNSSKEMTSYNDAGNCCYSSYNKDPSIIHEGINYYKKASEIAKRRSWLQSLKTHLSNIGGMYRKIEIEDEMLKYYNESIEVREILNDKYGIGDVKYYIGFYYENRNNYDEAANYWRESFQIFLELDKKDDILTVARNLGNCLSNGKHPEEAIKYFRYVIDMAKETNNVIEELKTYARIGNAYSNNNMDEESIKYNELCLKRAQEEDEQDIIAIAYNNLGLTYKDMKDYDKAAEYLKKAFEVSKSIDNKDSMASYAYELAKIYQEDEKLEDAINYFKISAEIFEEIDSLSSLRDSFRWLGKVYLDLKRNEESTYYYTKAAEVSLNANNLKNAGLDYRDVGYMYRTNGEMEKSIETYHKAINLSNQVEDYENVIDCYNGIAMTYYKMSDWNNCIEMFEEKLALAEKYGTLDQQRGCFYDIGNVCYKAQRYEEGFKAHGKAINLAEQLNLEQKVYDTYWELAYGYKSAEDYPEAIKIYKLLMQKAEKKLFLKDERTFAVYIAELYNKLGEHQEAINYYEQATFLDETLNDNPAQNLSNIGQVYESMGEALHAIHYYTKAWEHETVLGKPNQAFTYSNNLLNCYKRLEEVDLNLGDESERSNASKTKESIKIAGNFVNLTDIENILDNYQNILNDYKQDIDKFKENEQKADAVSAKSDTKTKIQEKLLSIENNIRILIKSGSLLINTKKFQDNIHKVSNAIDFASQSETNESIINTILQLCKVYKKEHRLEESIPLLKQAIKKSEKLSDPDLTENLLLKLIETQVNSDNLEDAIRIVQNLNDLNREKDPTKKARNLCILGSIMIRSKAFEKAKKNLEECIKICEKSGIDTYLEEALNQSCILHRYLGNYDKGIEFGKQALDIASELNDIESMAENSYNIGLIYKELTDTLNARLYLNKAYNLAELSEDIRKMIKYKEETAKLYHIQSISSSAIPVFQQALKLAEELGDNELIMKQMYNIANSYDQWKIDKQDALTWLEKALDYASKPEISQSFLRLFYNDYGVVLFKLDKHKEGLKYLNKAFDIATKLNDIDIIKKQSLEIYFAFKNIKEYDTARDSLFKLVDVLEEKGRKEDIAQVNNRIGQSYDQQSNFEKAIEYYKKSADFYATTDNLEMIKPTFRNTAMAYYSLRNYEEALKWFTKRHKEIKKFKDEKEIIKSLNETAYIYENMQRNDEAIELFTKGLKKAKESDDKEQIRYASHGMGLVHRNKKMVEEALKWFEKEAKMADEIEDYNNKTEALAWIAKCYSEMNRLEDSYDYYLLSMDSAKKAENYPKVAQEYANAGYIASLMENLNKAEELWLISANIYHQLKDYKNEEDIYDRLGWAYFKRKKYEKAAKYYAKRTEVIESAGIKMNMCKPYRAIANSYWNLKQYEKSIEYHLKEHQAARDINDIDTIVISLKEIGGNYYELQDYDNAIKFYKQGLEEYDELFPEELKTIPSDIKWQLYQNLGTAYRQRGDYEEALDSFSKAVDISKALNAHANTAWTLGSISILYDMQEDYNQAISYRKESLKLAEEHADLKELKNDYEKMRSLYEKIGNSAKISEFNEKIKILEYEIADEKNQGIFAEKYEDKIETLFSKDDEYVLLAGSLLSEYDPANIAPMKIFSRQILKKYLENLDEKEREIAEIISNYDLNYQIITESLNKVINTQPEFMTYFTENKVVNTMHVLCANIINNSQAVFTTNQDFLIGEALKKIVKKEEYNKIKTIITDEDYKEYYNTQSIDREKVLPVFKLSNSSLDLKKRPAIKSLIENKTLIVIGYPIRKEFSIEDLVHEFYGVKKIIWFHEKNTTKINIEKLKEIDDETKWSATKGIYPMLAQIANLRNIPVYRINTRTRNIASGKLFIQLAPQVKHISTNKQPDSNIELSKILEKTDPLDKSKSDRLLLELYFRLRDQDNYLRIMNKKIDKLKDDKKAELLIKASLLIEKGDFYRINNKIEEALAQYADASKIYESQEEWVKKADCDKRVGEIYLQKQDYELAWEKFEDSYALIEEANKRELYPIYLFELGRVAFAQSQFIEAMENWVTALKMIENRPSDELMVKLMTNISNVYHVQKDYDEELKRLNEALEKADEIDDIMQKLSILELIAENYRATGKLDKCLEMYEKILDMYRTLMLQEETAQTLTRIGAIYEELEKYKDALINYKESFSIAQMIQNKILETSIANLLAKCLYKNKEYEEGYNIIKNALIIAEKLGFESYIDPIRETMAQIQAKR
ncbi:MAG: tetratricopeptide repeat protein [Candidatus Lokiarchaeota archaeon]|nr:tetratricopeptide repeat protein [Candidatus Lokiarchaeota archaeon]